MLADCFHFGCCVGVLFAVVVLRGCRLLGFCFGYIGRLSFSLASVVLVLLFFMLFCLVFVGLRGVVSCTC